MSTSWLNEKDYERPAERTLMKNPRFRLIIALTSITLVFVVLNPLRSIADSPDHEVIRLNNAGVKKMDQKDYKGAIEDFNAALRIQSDYHLAHTNRLIAKYNLGDFEGIISDYEALRVQSNILAKAYAVMPDKMIAEGYSKRGIAAERQHKTATAIASFDEAIRLDPKAEYYHARATSRRAAGDNEGSQRDLREAHFE